MGQAVWGADPEFFGPRHAHREGRIVRCLDRVAPGAGLHLECAAGVGSLSLTLARLGRTVIAADRSPRSLAVLAERAAATGLASTVLPVVVDITGLPFADDTFASATSAETLEHISDHDRAVSELARVLEPGACLVGTVPAGPHQWSEWDDWAGHERRYTVAEMSAVLAGAGLDPTVTCWGWPVLRLYDAAVLTRINRRRLRHDGPVARDPTLRRFAGLGRWGALVALVRSLFAIDRLFDGSPWGVGLLFAARKRPTSS
jgi:ubiquinone/menaquinone biosynthesis C-methylase UbiE